MLAKCLVSYYVCYSFDLKIHELVARLVLQSALDYPKSKVEDGKKVSPKYYLGRSSLNEFHHQKWLVDPLANLTISSLFCFKRRAAVSIDGFASLRVKSYYQQSLQLELSFVEQNIGHLTNHRSLHEKLLSHLMTYDFVANLSLS